MYPGEIMTYNEKWTIHYQNYKNFLSKTSLFLQNPFNLENLEFSHPLRDPLPRYGLIKSAVLRRINNRNQTWCKRRPAYTRRPYGVTECMWKFASPQVCDAKYNVKWSIIISLQIYRPALTPKPRSLLSLRRPANRIKQNSDITFRFLCWPLWRHVKKRSTGELNDFSAL